MKLTCERTYLVAALNMVSRAVSGRNTLPILSHILFEALTDRVRLTATDMDTIISCEIPAAVSDNGAIAIPSSSLNDYVSKLPDAPISFTEKDGRVAVKSGKSEYKIGTSPAEDYPNVHESVEGTIIRVNQGVLKDMIKMTAWAASKEESRSLLMGVLFEAKGDQLTLVATDTHRLAKSTIKLATAIDSNKTISAIIPATPLIELERMIKSDPDLEVEICISNSKASFKTADTLLVSRILDGAFPNYEKVIPKEEDATTKLVFGRKDMVDALRRVQIVAQDNAQKHIFKIGKDGAILTAQSPTMGDAYEEVPITVDGNDLTMAFNTKYLIEVLNAIKEDDVSINLTSALRPGILKAQGNEDFLYVIMPMQA